MKSIKDSAKEWCSQNSNKKCKECCYGCWVAKTPMGCEQHNMELAYKEGANDVLDEIEKLVKFNRWAAQDLYELIEQLKK